MRWIGRAGSLLIAVVIVAGPPGLLLLAFRQGLWTWPGSAQLHAWLRDPPAAGLVAALIASVAVLLWALVSGYLVYRGWRSVSSNLRRLRRVPLPTPAQMTAGSMAGVAALALPGIVVQHAGAPPASTSAPSGAADAIGPDASHPSPRAGVDLPGGWVPYSTALAVSALGNLIWLQRRRHYQPLTSRVGRHEHDPDLQPLPETVEALIAGVSAGRPEPGEPGDALLAQLPTGAVVLCGPGAVDAARGVLVTAILRHALTGSGESVASIGARGLQALLGTATRDILPEPLEVIDDAAGAANAYEEAADSAEKAGEPTIQITVRPAKRDVPRDAGADLNTTITVALGSSELGGTPSWYVAADGTIASDAAAQRRICMLDVQAARDLLQLVRQSDHSTLPTSVPTGATPHLDEVMDSSPTGALILLGECKLLVEGNPVSIRRTAGLQILAYLAIHPAGATTNDLIRAIWPGVSPATITKRLHTTLTDLRGQLQPLLGDVVIRRDDRYVLNPETVDTDVRRLHEAITLASTALTEAQSRAAAEAIIAAHRGELAAGFTWPWLRNSREALRRQVIDSFLRLAATSPQAEAIELMHRAIAVDPYNEAVQDQAQRLLAAAGQQDLADGLALAYRQRLHAAGLTGLEPQAEHHGAGEAADQRL
jgi:DNA-binding SARP family transcriptional activator